MKNLIAANGKFFTQETTGVQLYARELYAYSVKNNDPIIWFAPKSAKGNIKDTKNVRFIGPKFIPNILWEQIILPIYTLKYHLFCPCNSCPLINLLFSKVTVTVHCLSFIYVKEAFSFSYRIYTGYLRF